MEGDNAKENDHTSENDLITIGGHRFDDPLGFEALDGRPNSFAYLLCRGCGISLSMLMRDWRPRIIRPGIKALVEPICVSRQD